MTHSLKSQNISSPQPKATVAPSFHFVPHFSPPWCLLHFPFPPTLHNISHEVVKWKKQTNTLFSSWNQKSQDHPVIEIFISTQKESYSCFMEVFNRNSTGLVLKWRKFPGKVTLKLRLEGEWIRQEKEENQTLWVRKAVVLEGEGEV